MPGELTVKLRAGEAVIYSGLLLHRGCTTAAAERLTVACNWNSVVSDDTTITSAHHKRSLLWGL